MLRSVLGDEPFRRILEAIGYRWRSVPAVREAMVAAAGAVLPRLPAERPCYAMGLGAPEDLVDLVGLGADMFDCVLPTRSARTGQLFTRHGRMVIKNSRHQEEDAPIDEGCTCYTCRHYSRAYLHHLVKANEILAAVLLTTVNLAYYQELMAGMRAAASSCSSSCGPARSGGPSTGRRRASRPAASGSSTSPRSPDGTATR